jgi:hypothetical protein
LQQRETKGGLLIQVSFFTIVSTFSRFWDLITFPDHNSQSSVDI